MTQYASILALSSLNGANGFRVDGVGPGGRSGFFIGPAGDLNNDGVDDFSIGAFELSAPAGQSGAAYVVFGSTGGFTASFSLSTLNGANGFRLTGANGGDNFGVWVSTAGDVNNDGIDDFISGAWLADTSGVDSGAGYVVFGSAGGFAASTSVAALNGSNGFRLIGPIANANAGFNTTAAGDVNGDGIDDFVVSANRFPSATGTTYVVFGSSSAFAADINLGALNGSNGFSLNGSGWTVSAGDINGDGFSDVIVGNPFHSPNGANSGATYVVFGGAGGFASSIDLNALNGSNGFRISGVAGGDNSAYSISVAGDINGDGFDDIVIGAPGIDGVGADSGAAYVVFGAATGFGANINLSALDGSNGFKLSGAAAGDQTGFSVSNLGDFNGDGFDDIVVGAWRANFASVDSGGAYVLFGSAGGFSANLDLSTLNGNNGFRIDGVAGTVSAGIAVSDAGDVNGDGFADVMIGAPNIANQTGATYIVYGGAPGEAVTRTGTVFSNQIFGGKFNDSLIGLAGDDTLDGGDGDDTLAGGAGSDTLRGGAGRDLADYSNNGSAIIADLALSAISGGDADGDVLASIESIIATLLDDSLIGSTAGNALFGAAGLDTLDGGAGNDTLDGGDDNDLILAQSGRDSVLGGAGNDSIDAAAGDDTVDGGAGNDQISGGTGFDILSGGNGNDTIQGGDDNDTLAGGKGFDFLLGQNGNDSLVGEDLSDTLVGGDGNDTLNGGIDNDRLIGEAQRDLIFGDAGDDIVDAGTGNDTVDGGGQRDSVFGGSGFDLIDGGSGNDTLTGGTDGDTLLGGAGFDILQGDAGDDVLNGGLSNDVIFGNAGNDTIIFDLGGGTDTLRDFTAGAASEDVISLTGFGAAFDSFAEVIGAATQTGAHVTIDFGNGDMLVIRNTLVAALHADDFTFG